ncbi:unnamed protein product [Mycena citricolor]|uniref:Uncharacterized protein n=1 Tax=Mycena citricolor TaxID=2018698 RepID=A0AAD2Q7I3_9AGAR|nr:unnamed protein product [Mycena citricolor]
MHADDSVHPGCHVGGRLVDTAELRGRSSATGRRAGRGDLCVGVGLVGYCNGTSVARLSLFGTDGRKLASIV